MLSIITFLGTGLLWFRIGQDSGMWMLDQKQLAEYLSYWTINRAVRDREARK